MIGSRAIGRSASGFILLTALAVGSATAQGPGAGGLPQQVRRGMESAMNDLGSQGAMTSLESLATVVGEAKLDSFLDGAVARLKLSPDGSYTASALDGGELVSVTVGKQKMAAEGTGERDGSWTHFSGSLTPARKAQSISLTLKARGQQVKVDCFNKYKKAEEDVTYYVGPLDGLFCLGLSGADSEG